MSNEGYSNYEGNLSGIADEGGLLDMWGAKLYNYNGKPTMVSAEKYEKQKDNVNQHLEHSESKAAEGEKYPYAGIGNTKKRYDAFYRDAYDNWQNRGKVLESMLNAPSLAASMQSQGLAGAQRGAAAANARGDLAGMRQALSAQGGAASNVIRQSGQARAGEDLGKLRQMLQHQQSLTGLYLTKEDLRNQAYGSAASLASQQNAIDAQNHIAQQQMAAQQKAATYGMIGGFAGGLADVAGQVAGGIESGGGMGQGWNSGYNHMGGGASWAPGQPPPPGFSSDERLKRNARPVGDIMSKPVRPRRSDDEATRKSFAEFMDSIGLLAPGESYWDGVHKLNAMGAQSFASDERVKKLHKLADSTPMIEYEYDQKKAREAGVQNVPRGRLVGTSANKVEQGGQLGKDMVKKTDNGMRYIEGDKGLGAAMAMAAQALKEAKSNPEGATQKAQHVIDMTIGSGDDIPAYGYEGGLSGPQLDSFDMQREVMRAERDARAGDPWPNPPTAEEQMEASGPGMWKMLEMQTDKNSRPMYRPGDKFFPEGEVDEHGYSLNEYGEPTLYHGHMVYPSSPPNRTDEDPNAIEVQHRPPPPPDGTRTFDPMDEARGYAEAGLPDFGEGRFHDPLKIRTRMTDPVDETRRKADSSILSTREIDKRRRLMGGEVALALKGGPEVKRAVKKKLEEYNMTPKKLDKGVFNEVLAIAMGQHPVDRGVLEPLPPAIVPLRPPEQQFSMVPDFGSGIEMKRNVREVKGSGKPPWADDLLKYGALMKIGEALERHRKMDARNANVGAMRQQDNPYYEDAIATTLGHTVGDHPGVQFFDQDSGMPADPRIGVNPSMLRYPDEQGQFERALPSRGLGQFERAMIGRVN